MDLADPERALAVAYAPPECRPGLTALFALDEKLGGIVGTTTEPTIGQMRLAWWREAIEKLGSGVAAAEPLLTALGDVVARGVSADLIAEIEDGWSALLDGEPDPAAIARHGAKRGGYLFLTAGRLLGCEDPALDAAGTGWALADLGHRHSDRHVRAEARAQARAILTPLAGRHWPRSTHPLAALTLLAMRDAGQEGARRQGSPARLLRLLRLRVTQR